jgi:hypothetical protein
MTLRKCRVDRPFPNHVIRHLVRTRPPPAVWAWVSYLNRFLSLTLRHRNAVTWTCDQHIWFSFIYIAIIITPPFCNNTRSRVSVLSLLSMVLFLWRAAFCPFQSSKELLFSSPFLSKSVMIVALLLGPLAPRMAASTTASLEW